MGDKHDRSMMENLYWWGVPTLFRAPHEAAAGADIALVGVPHSTGNGTTERDQHLDAGHARWCHCRSNAARQQARYPRRLRPRAARGTGSARPTSKGFPSCCDRACHPLSCPPSIDGVESRVNAGALANAVGRPEIFCRPGMWRGITRGRSNDRTGPPRAYPRGDRYCEDRREHCRAWRQDNAPVSGPGIRSIR